MFKTVILPFAKQDVEESAFWYDKKQKGLGKKFTFQVRKKISFIQNNPYATPLRYDDVRTSVLDVFPFMVHYIVDEPKKLIIISAILHTSRNPDIWKTDYENPDVTG